MTCFITKFQTLIVGGLGFLGVMATLAFNAWLSRRQHTRQIEHEGRTLRIALRAELEVTRESYKDRINTITTARPTSAFVLIPVDIITSVYDQLLDKLGLLSASETKAVIRAYVMIKQMPVALYLLQNAEESAPRGFIKVGRERFEAVKKLHENYLTDIDNALGAINL